MPDPLYLTPPEVAKRLRVRLDKVHGWIRRGELRAINVAESRAGRPRWRIPVEALGEWESGRTATAPAPRPARRRRAARRDGFKEYF